MIALQGMVDDKVFKAVWQKQLKNFNLQGLPWPSSALKSQTNQRKVEGEINTGAVANFCNIVKYLESS